MSDKCGVEARAAAAAAFVLGAKAQRRDVPPHQGMRDFDLVFDDGHYEPLEVTQYAHAPTRQTLARIGWEEGFDADELECIWWVWVPEFELASDGAEQPYDVDECLRQIVPVLAALEKAGVDRFSARDIETDPRVSLFAPIVKSLGVFAAVSPGPRGNNLVKPLFLRQHARRERGMRLHVITKAVEAAAADEGNRRKLEALQDAPRRHLFVSVDVYSAVECYSAVCQAFESGQQPPEPHLRDPITTAWVSVAYSTELLVITPPGRWEAHATPIAVKERPELWIIDSAE